MNFLQLCQALGRESGTAPVGQPISVVAQQGRLAKLVGWVQGAWVEIQNSREGWLFMRKDFLTDLIIGAGAYTAASLNITDWGQWVHDRPDGLEDLPFSIYDPAIGKSDEQPLYEMPWREFRAQFIVGAQESARPQRYAIGPDGSLNIGPAPDKAYKIRGVYVRDAQVLTANTDTPIMPTRFHDLIVWRALRRLNARDEAPLAMQTASQDEIALMGDLTRDQLPKIIVRREPMA